MPSQTARHRTEAGRNPASPVRTAHRNAGEEALWKQLREHRCDGFHFRRRAAIPGGVADFYCAAAKLAVQIVGTSRKVDRAEIARNEAALASAGLRVLRVPARVVARDPRAAARLVADALMESGHAPGPAKVSKHHFGPGPVGDLW